MWNTSEYRLGKFKVYKLVFVWIWKRIITAELHYSRLCEQRVLEVLTLQKPENVFKEALLPARADIKDVFEHIVNAVKRCI